MDNILIGHIRTYFDIILQKEVLYAHLYVISFCDMRL